MNSGQQTLLQAGASEQILMDFAALCESTTMDGLPKYAPRPTLETLSKILSAQTGGPNKDLALFELCHLVYAIGERNGPDQLIDFFLAPEKASPTTLKHRLDDMDQGVSVHYDGQSFNVRFGRMPVLIALFEFLCSMENFTYYGDVTAIFDELCQSKISSTTIKKAANALGSNLRKYRITHLSTAKADGKFLQVFKFLQDQNIDGQIILTDDSVFDFWCLHNTGKDYRGYKTVFDLFCDFAQSFDDAARTKAAANAAPLGLDYEAGEIEVAVDEESPVQEDWTNPFAVFDEEGFEDVRFFKKKSERQPFENLMAYGPDALRLPLAFLRYERFGPVQSAITTDLQVGRGTDSVKKRISCEGIPPYSSRIQECENLLDHLHELQQSSLHILTQDNTNIVAFPDGAAEQTKKAFARMNRKGFDNTAHEKRDLFEKASDALIVMERQLSKYKTLIADPSVKGCFDRDKAAFSNQFATLYAEQIS